MRHKVTKTYDKYKNDIKWDKKKIGKRRAAKNYSSSVGIYSKKIGRYIFRHNTRIKKNKLRPQLKEASVS